MAKRTRAPIRALLTVALAGLLLGAAGCGYLKNVRDDLLDIGTVSLGVVPPVPPTQDGRKAAGFMPPCVGAYVELTEFCHLGAIYKMTGELEWDRRGLGVMVDRRKKIGFGPWHRVLIEQTPISANAYKRPGGQMEGWRKHMRELTDPIYHRPAKVLIYEVETVGEDPYGIEGWEPVRKAPFLYRGWQDWETVSVELAVPEPFITHSGFSVRLGVDPSQVFDAALTIIGLDLYDDAAYRFWGGLRFPGEGKQKPGFMDRFFGDP